ncbi:MAG: hypothetical protein R3F56_03240 [Planctomycetota bacterium]
MSVPAARAVGPFALLALAVVVACARTPPWFERDALQGEVMVRGAGVDLRGRLTFARPTPSGRGTLQFDVERAGHLDNATLLVGGGTTAFTDGVPRAPSAVEERVLAVLAGLLGWPGADAAREADGERIAAVTLPGGGRFVVELGAELPPPHHAPR